MSKGASVEELRERVDALTDSISSLSGGMEGLRQGLIAKEKRVRDLEAELEAARRVGAGIFTTLVETMVSMGASLLSVLGAVGGIIAWLPGLIGTGAVVFALFSDCDAPPESMRLEGLGTAMIATPDRAPIGARCDFFARQVGRGECLFELRCEGESTYAETHRCITDSYTHDTGEGGTSTSYFLRGMSHGETVFSFSEREQLLEIKDGDSRLTLVFHQISGRSVLDDEAQWPVAGAE